MAAYDILNIGLRDQAVYLGHDLNNDSLSDVSDEMRAMSKLVTELDGRFDSTQAAAEAYIHSRALPGQMEGDVAGECHHREGGTRRFRDVDIEKPNVVRTPERFADVLVRDDGRSGLTEVLVSAGVVGMIVGIQEEFDGFVADSRNGLSNVPGVMCELVIYEKHVLGTDIDTHVSRA